ncbi:hypothetical protein SDC9_179758 [bioreactor metagenome]|uniref:Uncharacterized protein n=1 Tax=bioreactor metagenome TaxID=1076179 RepID=A0A645H0R4_9ZZZZ
MQLEQRIVMRGVRQREAALFAILEQDVDVLAGEELQALAGRQAQVQFDDIRGQFFKFFDARGQCLGRNLVGRGDLPAFDAQVGLGPGAAVERHAGGLFRIRQGVRLGLPVVYEAGLDVSLASATGAILAAVGHGQALTQCRVEQGFIGFRSELAAARLDGDLIAHRFPSLLG